VWTALRAAAIATPTFEIHQVMELHREFGMATLILGVLLVVGDSGSVTNGIFECA